MKEHNSIRTFLHTVLLTAVSAAFLCVFSLTAAAAETSTTPSSTSSCNKSCSAAKECTMKKTGSFFSNNTSQVKAGCLKEATKNGCFDSAPSSSISSITSPGARRKGAGGNSKPRNHYGMDLGTGGVTNAYAYAPADGTIVMTRNSTGGGRTIVIDHEKKCEGGSGKYHTIFMHLLKYLKTSGSVKKGEPVGIVGGSNYAPLCDNPAQCQKGTCCSHYYAIHLHMEVADGSGKQNGGFVASSQISGSVYQGNCGNLQVLCGGCPADTSKCGGYQPYSDQNGASAADMATGDGATEAAASQCSLEGYLDSSTCVFCGLFRIIFNTASSMALTAITKLSAPSRDLVLLGFLIWLGLFVLKNVASFQGTKPADMMKGIIFQGFRVALVVVILSASNIYKAMDLTLNPVMKTGLNFANSLNANSTCDKNADYAQSIIGYESGEITSETGNKDNAGGLSKDLGVSFVCSIKNLEDSVGVLMALGNYSVCLSFHDFLSSEGFLPHLGYLSTGVFLWLCGLMLILLMPWCLVDCILQLCVSAALLPCAIAAFAFKVTAKYIKVIWNFFMNAMFNVVFMAIVIFALTAILKDWINLQADQGYDAGLFLDAMDGLAWWGLGAMKVLAFCFLFFCFLGEAGKMADKFASSASLGGSKGIGRMVGGTLGDISGKMGKAGLKVGGKMASGAATAVGEGVNSLVGNKVRSMVNHGKGRVMGMLPGTEKIRDADGNTIGYKNSFKFMGFQHTREVTKDASGVWTQQKETHQRTKLEKGFEKVTDENGNETYVAVTRNMLGQVKERDEMIKSVDKDGNTVFMTADGKAKLMLDSSGKITSFQRKTDAFSRKAYQSRSVTNVNDSFMKTRVVTDREGNVVGADTEFKNVSSKYMVNKDGSTNMHAYNQIMNGSGNKEAAAVAMVAEHMKARGQTLANRFKDRKYSVDKDGTVHIRQVNHDDSVQEVKARMVDGRMVIENTVTDKNGMKAYRKTNGIQTKTVAAVKEKDGTYTVKTRYSFTDEAKGRSWNNKPLNEKGEWGYGINAKDAMAGFSEKEFNEHLAKLQNDEKARQEALHGRKYTGTVNEIHGLTKEQADTIIAGGGANNLAGNPESGSKPEGKTADPLSGGTGRNAGDENRQKAENDEQEKREETRKKENHDIGERANEFLNLLNDIHNKNEELNNKIIEKVSSMADEVAGGYDKLSDGDKRKVAEKIAEVMAVKDYNNRFSGEVRSKLEEIIKKADAGKF